MNADTYGPIPFEAHLTYDYFDIGGHEGKLEDSEDSLDCYLADWRPECVRVDE